MMLEPNETLKQDEQVAEAQRQVDRARAELADSLSTATENGTAMLKQAAQKARPVLIGVAAVGAAFLSYKIIKSAVTPRRPQWIRPPRQPSIIGGILRSTVLSVGSALASRAAQRAILKWTENTQTESVNTWPATTR